MGLWVSFQKRRVSARTQNVPEVKAGGESSGNARTPKVPGAIEEALRPPRPAPEASIQAVGFSFFGKRSTGPFLRHFHPFRGAKLEFYSFSCRLAEVITTGKREKKDGPRSSLPGIKLPEMPLSAGFKTPNQTFLKALRIRRCTRIREANHTFRHTIKHREVFVYSQSP